MLIILGNLTQAKNIARTFIATADTSKGAVTEEIITFHLVPDIRKSFNKWAKEVGCSAKSRQLTREEQDKINKTRKSVRGVRPVPPCFAAHRVADSSFRQLMYYTSVTVTPAAQAAYLAKNPQPVVAAIAPQAAAGCRRTRAQGCRRHDGDGEEGPRSQEGCEPDGRSQAGGALGEEGEGLIRDSRDELVPPPRIPHSSLAPLVLLFICFTLSLVTK